ncbi:MAG TPA: aromatic ring-hydroxylating dioxygenase subunit alpha [Alphaproteobacteria bacterium]|nr:aromatic ring-hydroxylating dioxygenase subunit alpha [Alphaproteobacteria bacterium]
MSITANESGSYDSGQALPFVDSRLYTDQSIFEEELGKIWKGSWLPAVHESELAAPLDFRTITVAREPIVIVRGSDGKVRAFRNVCPHRGNLIVRKPAGNLALAEPSGNANHMTCMFHAWQFDSFGRCVDIPRMKQGYQDRLTKADVALTEVRSEVAYGGFVWLCLDPGAVSLAAYIGDAFGIMREELDTEPLDVFHYHKAYINSNYKLWHDTNSEFYHDYMHYFNRATSMMQKGYFERTYTAFPHGHATVGSMEVKYDAYEGVAERPLSFPGMPRNGWKMVDLFPGATFNIRGSSLRVDTMTPLGPNLVMIEFRGLGLKRDTAAERHQRIRDHNTIWGPFGRNLHEDLLGITGQGVAMRPGTEPRHILHGRRENNTIHDEIGMRHYYQEWGRVMGRSPSDPGRAHGLAAE